MKKNQIIILIIIIVLIFGGIIGWTLFQKSKILTDQENSEKQETEQLFNFTAAVLNIDTENNFLIVKPKEKENSVKVFLSDNTKLIKIEFPFDPKNPPKEAVLTPIQTEIEISDFKTGDNVLIKSRENIAGKTEIDNIDFVHILP